MRGIKTKVPNQSSLFQQHGAAKEAVKPVTRCLCRHTRLLHSQYDNPFCLASARMFCVLRHFGEQAIIKNAFWKLAAQIIWKPEAVTSFCLRPSGYEYGTPNNSAQQVEATHNQTNAEANLTHFADFLRLDTQHCEETAKQTVTQEHLQTALKQAGFVSVQSRSCVSEVSHGQ